MRQFIQSIQRSRGISVAELAAMLGYKSQTSVARIMHGKANVESVTRFCQLMNACEALALTDEETDQLGRVLERKRLSQAEYAATDILRLLLREDLPVVDPVLVLVNTGERQRMMERYLPMTDMRITILNCETVLLFGSLAQLVRQGKAKVEHYLYSDDSLLRTVMTIRAALPILHENGYFGGLTYVSREEILNNPRGILMADVMLCEYEREGTPWYDLVIFQNKEEGMCFTFPGSGTTVHRMMEAVKAKAQPLRNGGMPSLREGYSAYLRYCSNLERDRAVYRIKPDFGMEQIPAEIWIRAFKEGPMAGDLTAVGDTKEMAELTRQRQKNTFSKKQAQHHVFKQRAVWKFVRTGRLSDQFWAFRTLTMQERLETLRNMLEQHTQNPYYKLHFLKDEDCIRDDEIICYDGMGIIFIKAGTDYNLQAAHSEIMVSQPEFLRIYRQFFLHSILPNSVQPEYKTRKILLEMIDYCQKNLQEEKTAT
ncbi:MAG: hypothetical protein E7316_10865 [Clostridiales bacterium]|nr:hypothetical protein [Clostridiales bacterium]